MALVGFGVIGCGVVVDGPVIVDSEVAAVVDHIEMVVSQHPQKCPGDSHVVSMLAHPLHLKAQRGMILAKGGGCWNTNERQPVKV